LALFYRHGDEKSGAPAIAFNPCIFGNLIWHARDVVQLTVVEH
jgi:hypothetical protein